MFKNLTFRFMVFGEVENQPLPEVQVLGNTESRALSLMWDLKMAEALKVSKQVTETHFIKINCIKNISSLSLRCGYIPTGIQKKYVRIFAKQIYLAQDILVIEFLN